MGDVSNLTKLQPLGHKTFACHTCDFQDTLRHKGSFISEIADVPQLKWDWKGTMFPAIILKAVLISQYSVGDFCTAKALDGVEFVVLI